MDAIRAYWNSSAAFRFVVVGTACAILYFAICLFLSRVVGLSAFFASLNAYFVCFWIGYSSQREIAFRSATSHRITFKRYFIWHAFGATTVSLAANVASRSLALEPITIALLSTVFCGIVSLVISSCWIFRNS